MLGKRKREAVPVARQTKTVEESENEGAEAISHDQIFRKCFETKFEPLGNHDRKTDRDAEIVPSEQNYDEDKSDWSGLRDDESEHQVQIVEHVRPRDLNNGRQDEIELKTYMTSKPPATVPSTSATKRRRQKDEDPEEEANDTANLKNDLALQRLLKESHLLEGPSSSAPSGKNRHKAMDLRLLSLGSKASIFSQQKMPMSHRKGIQAKANQKEVVRRKEAVENGIILERPSKASKTRTGKRGRGVGGPTVGKFAGGTLKLRGKDLADIKSPSKTSKGGRKSRR